MKITDARFIKSVYHLQDLSKPVLPEFAFSGRSNVGKSSLINVASQSKGVCENKFHTRQDPVNKFYGNKQLASVLLICPDMAMPMFPVRTQEVAAAY